MARLKKLLDEHSSPQHCTKQDVHNMIAPLLAVGARVQKQIIEYKARLTEEELSGQNPLHDGETEHHHQTFGAIEREAIAFMVAGRNLAKAMTQLDRYMEEAKVESTRAPVARVAAPLQIPSEVPAPVEPQPGE